MTTKTKRNYGKITLELLDILFQFIGESTECFVDQDNIRKKIKSGRLASSRLVDYLSYLNRAGYAKIKPQKGNPKNKILSIKLTKKGRLKLLENSNNNIVDGKWRMLSFDIPEKIKNKRNRFRSAIKRIGFRQVQKSLWACPFVKADEVEKAIIYHKLQKYVAYLIVEKSDINSYLMNIFRDTLKKKSKFKTQKY